MVLTELQKGKQARIMDLSHVSPSIQRRLLDLGVDEGTTVCIKGLLPFQGPCMIEVCGQCISLRRNDASCIKVYTEE
ncbi:FeoA family protein [Ectobacillus ponti]|uniref:Ferrous iron transport protein A n=1 Tax=Ectobacillus ponti TaxID=2961894 RepID=A0AA42BQW2_9BACI|nr:FeoA family protein [Ectobacillus ponti]MCP8970317.1 ferrous iron transport protein A [Ectobacillus ponti]